MQHNKHTTLAPLKLRFLLTSDCTASCAYCHNEGQAKDKTYLALADIAHVLNPFAAAGQRVDEIILSGGEPTLHPQLAAIAQRAKASGALVSINTHGAHPGLLERALPWVDELKLHIDSFDPQRQKRSMGLSIDKVLQSIERSRQHHVLRTVVNHPLQSLHEAREVIATTRALGVECKFIELLDAAQGYPQLADIPWAELGYQPAGPGLWLYPGSGHRAMARRCNATSTDITWFVGADGVRTDLQSPSLGAARDFSAAMVKTLPAAHPPVRTANARNARKAQVVRFFAHPHAWARPA